MLLTSGLQIGQEQQPPPSAAVAADTACPKQPDMSIKDPQVISDLQLLWEAAQAAMAEAEQPQRDSLQHQRPDQAPPEQEPHHKAPCSSTFSVPGDSAAQTAHHHQQAIPVQGQGILGHGQGNAHQRSSRQWRTSTDQKAQDSFALVSSSADQHSHPVSAEHHNSSGRDQQSQPEAQSQPMPVAQSQLRSLQQSRPMSRPWSSSRHEQRSAGDSIARALQRLGSTAPSQGARTLPRQGSMAPSQATEGAGQRKAGPRGVQPLLGETTLNMLQVGLPKLLAGTQHCHMVVQDWLL